MSSEPAAAASDPVRRLRAMLGAYPGTRPLLDGAVACARVALDFVPDAVPQKQFRRVVRERVFDVAEIAIATYLVAKAHGRPLVLLPATVLGRHQHSRLVYNPASGPLTPGGLAGKRVGIRSYSVTTVMWVRGVLARDHGVDLDRVHWVTFEDPHVLEFQDPPGVERATAGKDPASMLLAGELDAAVLGDPPPADSPLRSLIPDPDAAGMDWCRRYGAVPVNHLVAVDADLAAAEPDTVSEVYRMMAEARRVGASGDWDGLDLLPFGFAALAPSLSVAIDYAFAQGLLPRRLAVEELFDDNTRMLGAS